MKEPKIVQIGVNGAGMIRSAVYDNGRTFSSQKQTDLNGCESYVWVEIVYPIPRIPIPPATARIGRRGRKQK